MEYIKCDLCGADDYTRLYRLKQIFISKEAFFTLVKCKKCGLIYINPQPDKQEMLPYYMELENYYAYKSDENDSTELYTRLLHSISNHAIREAFKERHPINIGLLLYYISRHRFSTFPREKRNHGKILDVGTGSGFYLKQVKKLGWNVYGVDINAQAAKIANRNGLNVFCGELADAKYPNNFFDLIRISMVLEHVHSPREYINEAYRVLKPGGLLGISVPNIGGYTAHLYKEKWAILDVPQHLFQFTDKCFAYGHFALGLR
ncbi:MAG: ubiquinone/menaquinone biosynthesis methylase-like protein, partial [uncultured bacterium]